MSICSLQAQGQCPRKCSSRRELAGFIEGSLPVTVTKVTLMWLWLVPFRSSLFGAPVGTYTTVYAEIPDTHSLKKGWKHWQTVQVNWDRMRYMTGSPVTAKKHMQIRAYLLSLLRTSQPQYILTENHSSIWVKHGPDKWIRQRNKQAPHLAKYIPNCPKIPFALCSVWILTLFTLPSIKTLSFKA